MEINEVIKKINKLHFLGHRNMLIRGLSTDDTVQLSEDLSKLNYKHRLHTFGELFIWW